MAPGDEGARPVGPENSRIGGLIGRTGGGHDGLAGLVAPGQLGVSATARAARSSGSCCGALEGRTRTRGAAAGQASCSALMWASTAVRCFLSVTAAWLTCCWPGSKAAKGRTCPLTRICSRPSGNSPVDVAAGQVSGELTRLEHDAAVVAHHEVPGDVALLAQAENVGQPDGQHVERAVPVVGPGGGLGEARFGAPRSRAGTRCPRRCRRRRPGASLSRGGPAACGWPARRGPSPGPRAGRTGSRPAAPPAPSRTGSCHRCACRLGRPGTPNACPSRRPPDGRGPRPVGRPIPRCGDVEVAAEGRGGFLVAGGHGAVLLESGPDVLDAVARAAGAAVAGCRRVRSVGGDAGLGAPGSSSPRGTPRPAQAVPRR